MRSLVTGVVDFFVDLVVVLGVDLDIDGDGDVNLTLKH